MSSIDEVWDNIITLPSYKIVRLYSKEQAEAHPESKGIAIGYCDYENSIDLNDRNYYILGIKSGFKYTHWKPLFSPANSVKEWQDINTAPENELIEIYSKKFEQKVGIEQKGIFIGRKKTVKDQTFFIDDLGGVLYWKFDNWKPLSPPVTE